MDACRGLKRAEITIASQEKDAPVDTGLSDERITQASPSSSCQHFCAEQARALPVAVCDLYQGQSSEALSDLGRQLRVAQKLTEDDWRHYRLFVAERPAKQFYVVLCGPLKIRDPRAGVSRDHRSSFNSSTEREKRTLPRN